jgi:hypothetical protein
MGIGEEKPKTDSQETGVGHPKEKSRGFTTEDTENNGGNGELGRRGAMAETLRTQTARAQMTGRFDGARRNEWCVK